MPPDTVILKDTKGNTNRHIDITLNTETWTRMDIIKKLLKKIKELLKLTENTNLKWECHHYITEYWG